MGKIIKISALSLVGLFALLVVALDIWGFATLGSISLESNPAIDEDANKVVMVFGATGSVGDGLLKAAVEDPNVDKVYVITRRTSPRIEAGVASGKVVLRMHKDFTDYASVSDILGQTNTVMWSLGTTSIGVDDATYTLVNVDFPVAFVTAWLAARRDAPMSFHYVAGMGTDANGDQQWAREKGRTENEVAYLAQDSGLRTFSYRSAFVRPTSEQAGTLHYFLEALLRPGSLVISAKELGEAMLEISARTTTLKNGTLIDNADSIAYAKAYEERIDKR